jgi:small GTP-binding protein
MQTLIIGKVEKWMKELKEHADENILIAVVGNKCDRENDRQIKEKDAVEFAKSQKCRHFQTSAKTGGGTEDLFMYIAKGKSFQ